MCGGAGLGGALALDTKQPDHDGGFGCGAGIRRGETVEEALLVGRLVESG